MDYHSLSLTPFLSLSLTPPLYPSQLPTQSPLSLSHSNPSLSPKPYTFAARSNILFPYDPL